MDLKTGWDLADKGVQRKVQKLVDEDEPHLVITCSPCDAFSQLNENLNYLKMEPQKAQELKEKGRKHLTFAMTVCWKQLLARRYFLHEHPDRASSWSEDCVATLAARPEVIRVRTDMCRWNLRYVEGPEGRPSMKPTGS